MGAGLGSGGRNTPPGGDHKTPGGTMALPHALVANREEGLEAISLATGQTICQLHLPAGGLHADLDADGVPDHVQVGTDSQAACWVMCVLARVC